MGPNEILPSPKVPKVAVNLHLNQPLSKACIDVSPNVLSPELYVCATTPVSKLKTAEVTLVELPLKDN